MSKTLILIMAILVFSPIIVGANTDNKVLIAFTQRGINEMNVLNITKEQVVTRIVEGTNFANNIFGIGFSYYNPYGKNYFIYDNADVDTLDKLRERSRVLHNQYPDWKVIIWVDWNPSQMTASFSPHSSYELKPYQGDYGIAVIDLLPWQQYKQYKFYISQCDSQTGKPGLGAPIHEIGHVLGILDMQDQEPSVMNRLSSCYYNINSANTVIATRIKYNI